MLQCSLSVVVFLVYFVYPGLSVGEDLDLSSVKLYYFAPEMETELLLNNDTTELPYFSNSETVKVIIHGYWAGYKHLSISPLRNAYLSSGAHNVICVDWMELANGFYPTVRYRVPKVGKHVGFLLKTQLMPRYPNLSLDRFHILGHSLGAHIAGNVGRSFEGRVGRVTGLDPAHPLFSPGDSDWLSPSTGVFVDTIHTAGNTLGQMTPTGHASFYPNGGPPPQPGCLALDSITFIQCSHLRAPIFYAESIIHPKAFPAAKCDYKIISNDPDSCPKLREADNVIYMGEALDQSTNGTFFFLTYSVPPYGKGAKSQVTSIERFRELDEDDIFMLISDPSLKYPAIKLRSVLRKIKEKSTNRNETMSLDEDETDETNASLNIPSQRETQNANASISLYYKTLQVDYRKLITDECPYILKYYETNNHKIRDYHRTDIVETIVKLYVKSSTFMDDAAMNTAAEAICQIFENEDKVLYYVPPSTGHSRAGILYNTYNRITRRLRKEGTWPSKYRPRVQKESESQIQDADFSDDKIYMKNWLRTHKSPWTTVEKYWIDTYEMRKADLVSKKDMLEEWPLFQHSDGWRMIEIDFLQRFGHNGHFLEQFPNFVANTAFLQSHLKDPECLELLKKFPECTDDTKDYLALYFLHHLLPPTVTKKMKEPNNEGRNQVTGKKTSSEASKKVTREKKVTKETAAATSVASTKETKPTKQKKTFKPTIIDSINSMLIFIANEENIRLELEELDASHKIGRTKRQPLIILIGSQDNIEGIVLSVNHVLYKFNSLLSCVDVLIKLHYSLNLCYASESKLVYEFLERYFYGLSPDKSTSSTSVTHLISKLKNAI
ncbi:hypothetical protein DMENIID0001_008020 [Sergentomyia squamirostris]